MHELGIAFHVIEEIDKFAEEKKIDSVKAVTLEIGEVSAIIPKYLEDVWTWACEHRSKYMKGCKLKIIVTKAISFCEDCQKTYSTLEGKVCPNCGSKNTYLVDGNEAKIKNIEVADS